MEIKSSELIQKDLEVINKLYNEYKNDNEDYEGTSLDFAADFLERCECCGEIHYYDELTSYNGQDVCDECLKELKYDDESSKNYEPDFYDEYRDRLLEEGLI